MFKRLEDGNFRWPKDEEEAEDGAEYADVKELNREVLNRLISSITVGDRVRENGKTTQKITIRYKFIGML